MKQIIALFLLLPLFGHAAPRIATADWTIAETLTALGVPPLAVGDKTAYGKWVAHPPLDEHSHDSGVRMQPNLEYLSRLKPDFFIQSAFYAGSQKQLQKIAPVHEINMGDENGITWAHTVKSTRAIAQWAQIPQRAEQLITQTEQQFQKQKKQLQAHNARPIAVVQFINARQLRIYGRTSLFHVVLNQLGLQNAWQGESNAWGFTNLTLADLSKLPPNTLLIVVKPHPANIGRNLQNSAVWQRLPQSNAKHHRVLPAAWAYGGLVAMQRFGDLMTQALLQQKSEAW